ncbi:MAG: acyl-CoA carboxylase subunit epsilon [Candidatus Nanopelagicales bacterium]
MSSRESTRGAPTAVSVVSGSPTDTELAVVFSLLTRLSQSSVVQPNPPSRWSDRAAMMRPAISPGDGAWRASSFPQQ